MTRIAHLSDLHFGAHEPGLIDPLCEAVHAAQPDLVVISGDLAQRGTRGQFAKARALLDALPGPRFCVPGNHDLPHWNPILRFVDGYGRFRRATQGPTEPVWRDDATALAGINTAHRLHWQRGEIDPGQIDHLRHGFDEAGDRLRIAVMHHPLEHAALNIDPLMVGAGRLLAALPGMGARIVLSGHVHVSYVAPFTDTPEVLFVQNGTSLSTRRRGEDNLFLTLDTGRDRVRITRHVADGTRYVPHHPEHWSLAPGGWQRDTASGAGVTPRTRSARA
ncbi:metallophosphoesterase family protein [Pararhodobacter marinus]|uniref:metallophosphoesterase family protein n=1 Tax=Pararhodobacter marinus TaxID=2184063 RepID=UPI003512778C